MAIRDLHSVQDNHQHEHNDNIVQLFGEKQEAKGLRAKISGVMDSFKGRLQNAAEVAMERVPFVKGTVEKTSEVFSKAYDAVLKPEMKEDNIIAFQKPVKMQKDTVQVIGSAVLKTREERTEEKPAGELVSFRQKPEQKQSFFQKIKNILPSAKNTEGEVVSMKEHQKKKGIIMFADEAPEAHARRVQKNTTDVLVPELLADKELLVAFVEDPKHTFGDLFWLVWTDLSTQITDQGTRDDVEGAMLGYKNFGVWESTDTELKWSLLPDMLVQMGLVLPTELANFIEVKAANTTPGSMEIKQAS